MRTLLLALITTFLTAPALSAPLWIERKFIPEPALIDPAFAKHQDTEQQTLDHRLWADFLSRYVKQGEDGIARVAYGAITPEDRKTLATYITTLEAVDTAALTRDQQLSFWINLYNASTVQLILENYPTKSIRKLNDPWATPRVTILAADSLPLTLGDIEHHIVRALWPDPRIHYALNCASIGCPNLAAKPYTAETLDAMLEDAARAYVNHPRGVRVRKGKVRASKIYGWYREDFGADEAAALDHIRRYAKPGLLSDLDAITSIRRYSYDWDLNDALVTDATP